MKNCCIVEGCNNDEKARGYCGKHYERFKKYGDVTVNNKVGRNSPFRKCKVEGCETYATSKAQMLCALHYGRWYRTGKVESSVPNYGKKRHVHKQGYIRVWDGQKYVLEHVMLAEKALGRPLPEKAVVHHMNNNPADNHTPYNLVICPDQNYHFILHARAERLGYKMFDRNKGE